MWSCKLLFRSDVIHGAGYTVVGCECARELQVVISRLAVEQLNRRWMQQSGDGVGCWPPAEVASSVVKSAEEAK
nr:hypothetical protein CFP56_10001 [Quercus suber]